jgi:pyrroline-5-carboxylate reductase
VIGLIGSGNIARALARGLGEPVLCTDGGSGRAQALAAECGGESLTSNAELAERADLVVLAHKPAQLEGVAEAVAGRAVEVISLLGGVPLARVQELFPGASVTRAMPNTAMEVRRGVTCLADGASPAARALFERVGTIVELPEKLIDAATAISGVGPAYVALLAEAWVDAGVKQGLGADVAATLVAQTIAGSAELLAARGMDTLEVRREVTSPGGMTARGLAALEEAGVRAAFTAAAEAVLP